MKPVLLALVVLCLKNTAPRWPRRLKWSTPPMQRRPLPPLLSTARRVRVALTIGAIGLSPAQIDALPALTLICVLGAGYENVAG